MSIRAQQKEEKKQSLLSAAFSLFTQNGVSKTSVDEIARQANVAKGTFYLYFQDKGQLLQELVLRISTRVLDEAYRHVRQHDAGSFTENVILLMDYVIEYFKRNKLCLRLIERNFSWPMVAQQLTARTDPLWTALCHDLETSPLAHQRPPEEVFKFIFVIMEMCGATCYSSIIEGKPDTIDNMKPVLYEIVRKALS